MKRGTPLARKTPMRQISAKKKAHRATDEGKADKEHMGLVARLPCVICGFWPVQVHHVIHGRYSARRSSDRHTIPLCFPHHAELHAGKESWAAKWGPDYGYLPYVAAQVDAMKNPPRMNGTGSKQGEAQMTDNDQKAGCCKDSTGGEDVKLDMTGLVKGLEWSLPIPKQNGTEHLTTCGQYKVVEWFDKSGHVLSFHRFGKPMRIEAETRACGADVLKAAAQADYTARIIAALDTDAIAALVGALTAWKSAGTDADYYQAVQMRNTAIERLGVTE